MFWIFQYGYWKDQNIYYLNQENFQNCILKAFKRQKVQICDLSQVLSFLAARILQFYKQVFELSNIAEQFQGLTSKNSGLFFFLFFFLTPLTYRVKSIKVAFEIWLEVGHSIWCTMNWFKDFSLKKKLQCTLTTRKYPCMNLDLGTT